MPSLSKKKSGKNIHTATKGKAFVETGKKESFRHITSLAKFTTQERKWANQTMWEKLRDATTKDSTSLFTQRRRKIRERSSHLTERSSRITETLTPETKAF